MLSSSKNLVFDALHDPQECLYNLKCKYLTFPNLLNILPMNLFKHVLSKSIRIYIAGSLRMAQYHMQIIDHG
jgi:hypothetical protein